MMAGCTSTTSEWQEEVQLSDGTVLDVHRTIRFEKAGGAPDGVRGDGWIADGENLSFVEPGTGRVIEWSGHRRTAALLDRVDGKYVIVASQARCEFEDRGRRIWRVYVLTSTGWWAGVPLGLSNNRTPDPALDSRGCSKTKGWSRATVAQKRQLDAASRVSRELKTIDLNDPTQCNWIKTEYCVAPRAVQGPNSAVRSGSKAPVECPLLGLVRFAAFCSRFVDQGGAVRDATHAACARRLRVLQV